MFKVTAIQHAYSEPGPFTVNRKQGYVGYTFLHFYNRMEIQLHDKTIITRPHACILYAPGTKQYFHSDTYMTHDWFHFFTDTPLPDRMLCDTIYYPSDPSAVTALVQELGTEYYSQKPHCNELINLKTLELFIKIVRSANYDNNIAVSHQQKKDLSALRTHIFSHFEEQWTVEKMAKRVNLSVSHFHSLYQSLYGKSPMDDLIHARCNAAHVALSHSNDSIASIAKQLGYNSVSHFIRQFRSIYGISPGALRKQMKSDPRPWWAVPPLESADNNHTLRHPVSSTPE